MCMSLYVHLCVQKDHYIVKMGTQYNLPNPKFGIGVNNLLSIKIKCFLYKQSIRKIFYICRKVFFLYLHIFFFHFKHFSA